VKPAERRKTICLTEYVTHSLPAREIPADVGEALWRQHGNRIGVEFPSPKTDHQWQLTPQGWVGYVPVSPELGFSLQPKVPLDNLFRMLEYAYRLESFEFLDDMMGCDSLEEFYERLANVLAKRVLDRARQGFYRAYLPETDRLPYVRGRLDMRHMMRRPWSAQLRCHYEEHTPDVEETQILAWTLRRIARSHLCSERVQPTVRRAYQSLRGFASLEPFRPGDCVGRVYNRLNDDYRPMHALCRFFLEHSGPTHEMGDRVIIPFLVNMGRLFELFVAEWLRAYLPAQLMLSVQEKVSIGEAETLRFEIDLVLSDASTGKPICVLDTKYKADEGPSPNDVAQVVTYAEMKNCRRAVLIYPVPLTQPLNHKLGDIHLRSMSFGLKGDLEERGTEFLCDLAGF